MSSPRVRRRPCGLRTDRTGDAYAELIRASLARRSVRTVSYGSGHCGIMTRIEGTPECGHGASTWLVWCPSPQIYFARFFLIGRIWMKHGRIVAPLRAIEVQGKVVNMMPLSLVALMPV
jgi:hypothetical protein